jgi:hypothetical protein
MRVCHPHPVECLAYYSIQKMEAVLSSEMLANFHWTPRHHNTEYTTFYSMTYTAMLAIKDLKIRNKEADSLAEEYI